MAAEIATGAQQDGPRITPEKYGIPRTLAEHCGPDLEELRSRAAALAALCRAPLSKGDAGLAEAARRLAATNAAVMALGYEGPIGIRIENEIINPIVNVAGDGLVKVLDRRAPRSSCGT